MKNSIISTILLLLMTQMVISQNSNCSVHLFLSPGGGFTGEYFPFNTSASDTVKKVITDNQYYLCYLQDCRGAMKFEAYNNDILVIQGNYANSPDTLKHCVIIDDGHSPNQSQVVKVETYFQPLKDGVWKYYDAQGRLIKEETWDRGILQEERDY